MKVLALGGVGGMGRAAVRNLVTFPEVEHVVIADIDLVRARQFADALESDKVSVRRVDATNRAELLAALREVDVIANTVGPFYKFGPPITEAAIEAGRHYIDICDDYDVTGKQLALDQRAREAGVSVLIGLGASPGVVNVLAHLGAAKLDQPQEIKLYWCGGGPGLIAATADRAAYIHMIHAVSGDVPTFKDGEVVMIPAWEEGEYFDFPPPFGRVEVFQLGHPEPITIPRFIPGLRRVAIMGSLIPSEENEVLRETARGHRKPLRPAKPPDRPVWQAPPGFASGGLSVVVEGLEDGQRVRYTYHVSNIGGGMAGFTGVPLAVGTVMLGLGLVRERGVLAPEACIDPDEFFKRLVLAYGQRSGQSYKAEDLILELRELI